MKKLILVFMLTLILTSCEKTSPTWENVKTAGRYLHKGFDSLWGKDYDSYWVQNEDEFTGPDQDFIPLNEKDLKDGFRTTDKTFAQPKESETLGFEKFSLPSHLSNLLKNVHFQTDDHVLREQEDLVVIQKVATYLKKNPKISLCIEGHCDARGAAAYNMALGTRRANHIRVLLIKQGIDFNRIYTVSYGKEKPIALGNSPQDWSLNRRGSFKIFERQ